MHFSNLKFFLGPIYYASDMIFITADVLNSAWFDLISFCEKFEINFILASSGPPVLTNFH